MNKSMLYLIVAVCLLCTVFGAQFLQAQSVESPLIPAQSCSQNTCVITLSPIADTFIDNYSATTRNTVRGALRFLESGYYSIGEDRYRGLALIRYDLTPLSQYGTNARIVAVQFSASHFGTYPLTPVEFDVYQVLNDSWHDTTTVWNTYSPVLSPPYASLAVPSYRSDSITVRRTWSLPPDLMTTMRAAGSTGSVALKVRDAQVEGFKICSREGGSLCGADTKPQLIVTIETNRAPGIVTPITPLNNQLDTPIQALTLQWTHAFDPDGDPVIYNVDFTILGQEWTSLVKGLTSPGIILSRLEPNVAYQWRITSIDSHGFATINPPWVFVTTFLPPPSELHANPIQNEILLDWRDNSTNEDRYDIEYRRDGIAWTPLATVKANVKSYKHTGIACGSAAYEYRVRAYRTADNLYSAYSEMQHAIPLLCGQGAVVLQWPPSGEEVTSMPRFHWTHDQRFVRYVLEIFAATGAKERLTSLPLEAATICTADCFYDFATQGQIMFYPGSFTWQVTGYPTAAPLSPTFSGHRLLKVVSGGPMLISPESSQVIGHAPVFTWSDPGFTVYDWYIGTGPSKIERTFAAEAICVNSLCTLNTGLMPNGESLVLTNNGEVAWGVTGRRPELSEKVKYSAERTLTFEWLPKICEEIFCVQLTAPKKTNPITNTITPFYWTEDPLQRYTDIKINIYHGNMYIGGSSFKSREHDCQPGTCLKEVCHLGSCYVLLPYSAVKYPSSNPATIYKWELELSRSDRSDIRPVKASAEFKLDFKPPVNVLLAPLDDAPLAPDGMLRWQADAGRRVGAYEIEIYDEATRISGPAKFIFTDNNNPPSGQVYCSSFNLQTTPPIPGECQIPLASIPLPPLVPGRVYLWRVIMHNSLQQTFNSNLETFTAALPAAPVMQHMTPTPVLSVIVLETPVSPIEATDVSMTETPPQSPTAEITETSMPSESTAAAFPTEIPPATALPTEILTEVLPTEIPPDTPIPPTVIPTDIPPQTETEMPAPADAP